MHKSFALNIKYDNRKSKGRNSLVKLNDVMEGESMIERVKK
jgi:hypothetical protein